MKILVICQYYYPEPFRISDICEELVHRGHEVTVITGIPNYPEGKIYKDYKNRQRRKEVINGVNVLRCSTIPRKSGVAYRFLNYYSYSIASTNYVKKLDNNYDVVLINQLSPVMMSAPGVLYKRICKVPLYTWVLDLWPESLTAAGGINNRYVLGFFKRFVKREYRYSDKILISSRSFEKSILEYGDYKDKIVYYPQWSDGAGGALIVPKEAPIIPDGFKLMFAGAVGEAHGFECTMEAARLTKEHKEIKWVMVQGFVKKHGLEDTVLTLGRFPAETMPWFFAKADVMLVTLSDDPLFRLYAPAKISSYMASGKPIVAVLNGEGTEVIRDAGCGWTLPAGDAGGFARLAVELSQMDKTLLAEKGAKAKRYYDEHFVKEKCLRELDRIMSI